MGVPEPNEMGRGGMWGGRWELGWKEVGEAGADTAPPRADADADAKAGHPRHVIQGGGGSQAYDFQATRAVAVVLSTRHHNKYPHPQAEKTLERIKAEGLIEKPFVPKRKAFTFPPVEKMGQKVWAGPAACVALGPAGGRAGVPGSAKLPIWS